MTTDHAAANKELLQKIIRRFETGDLAGVDALIDAQYVDHQGLGGKKLSGPEGFRRVVSAARDAMPNLHVSIEDLITEGDRVVARLRWHAPVVANQSSERETIDVLRIVDGRLAEHWGASVDVLPAAPDGSASAGTVRDGDWIQILRNASLGSFEGSNGGYPSVLEALGGLTAVQAAWKPAPDRHSVWQIVDHLTQSKECERRVILGERPPATVWNDPVGDEDAWRAAIQQLRVAQTQLFAAIDQLSEDDLWRHPPTKTNWPVVNLILNEASHDAYHAGQIQHLRALQKGLNDEMVTRLVKQGTMPRGQIEAAFRAVTREHFLPGVPLESVYSGEAVITRRRPDGVPISSSSMPEIMAIMLQQLDIQPGQRVLEIGAGTGYNAAVLSTLTGADGEVTTIDIDDAIVKEARKHLDRAGRPGVRTVTGDGWLGAPDHGPYDRIEVTVGISDLSPAWLSQLKDGGRLVVPLWLVRGKQVAVAFERDGERLRSVGVSDCGFMRLRGPHAGTETFMTVHGWTIPLDEPDPIRVAALQTLLGLEPRTEPAPPGPWGWPNRLLLEEPRALSLSRDNDSCKLAWGLLDISGEPSLVFVTARTWDNKLYAFGGDAARGSLLDWLTRARPLYVRHLSVEALPATAAPPSDGVVFRRRHFQFMIRT